MKPTPLIFTIFALLLSINMYGQTTYTWQGGSGDFTTATNWTPAGSPTGSSANIVFDNTNSITVSGIPQNITSLGDITIKNGSDVSFETSSTNAGILIQCNSLSIDENSSLNLEQTGPYIQLSFNLAEIYGSISLNNNQHKILPRSSTSILNFNNGSSFVAGENLTGSPFGYNASEKVLFSDGADYYHYGGNSPFGTAVNVVSFSPNSNYFIINDGANVLFSHKNYGNIIIGQADENFVNVIVDNSTGTATEAFSFNSITSENGSLKYSGNNTDSIKILGDINATSGNIELTGGVIQFIGDCYISSNNSSEVKLVSYATNNFTIIPATSSLTLESDLTIDIPTTINVDGLIDFETNKLLLTGSNPNISFSNTAELITANLNGIDASFNNHNFSFSNGTSFEYDGTQTQNFGFSTSQAIGKVIINNTSGVRMSSDVKIDSLFLDNGNFMIQNNTLTIKNDISRSNGHLFGSNTSNLSIINTDTGSSIDFEIDENLTLNNFDLNCEDANIYLQDGQTSLINNVTINNGSFYLGSNSLKVDSNLVLNSNTAILNIDAGTLLIDGTLDKNTGKLNGGNSAKLTFLQNASSAEIDMQELSELQIETDKTISLASDLEINNLLSLKDGLLDIQNNELFIHGNVINEQGIIETNTSSKISIVGSGNDITLPFNGGNINTLSINNTSGNIINIQNEITINNDLDLTYGKIRLVDSNLYFGDNASLSNHSANSYIITGGNYSVSKNLVAGETFDFPIGTNTEYAPCTITPKNEDIFFIKVIDNVYDNGLTGNIINNQQKVNLSWNIENDNSVLYDLSLFWNNTASGSQFNQENAYILNFNTNTNDWEKITGTTNVSFLGRIDYSGMTKLGSFFISSLVNNPPVADNQIFEIPEHSPEGTVVGNLIATETDANQTLTFYVQENQAEPDAFLFREDGAIIVKNPQLLEYSLHPVFNYTVDVCDNAVLEISCTQFDLTINLTEVIQDFMITNFISPNGDGKNDTWIIKGLEKGTYNVAVIDGKGNIIFRTDHYNNNWDGTKSGTKLAPGVYYYSITSDNFTHKGTITLVR